MEVVSSSLIYIRARKQDAAFVTFTLDAWEGVASHTTLPHQVGDGDRWLRLSFHASFRQLLIHILEELPILEVKDGSESDVGTLGT
jgi:hypothetical protein